VFSSKGFVHASIHIDCDELIGVDWGRANNIERTVDNAIDSAACLYLDIVNLFIRVLEIMGSAKDLVDD
jgi:FtsH-binding integral membrane protein